MKTLAVLLSVLFVSAAQAQTPTSIVAYGASRDPAHDNTAAINKCLDAAARDYFHCYRPPGWWHIKGSLKWERETGTVGFGFDGPGIVMEDSNNLPIFIAGGNGGQAPYIEGNFQYAHPQTAEMKNSACIRVDLPSKSHSVYNGWITLQCTNGWHGLDQKLGSFWGNVIPWLDCKNNSGSCIDLTTNKEAGAPNNHYGHVYINPVQGACPDGAEIRLENASNTVFDNVELNNSPCPIAATAGTRGVIYRNVRFEHGIIADHKFGGHGLIEAVDDGVIIEQYEVQTITVDVGGDFALFADLGSYGPADRLSGALNLLSSSVKSGSRLYGIHSPKVVVHSPPFLLWYVNAPADYAGDVSPSSPNVNP